MNSEQILENVRILETGRLPYLIDSDQHFLVQTLLQHGCIHYAKQLDNTIDTSIIKNRTQKMYESVRKIFLKLNDEDIPYSLLKGIVLSDLAYGDAYLRNSRDIDLLIDPTSHKAVHDVLLTAGCKQGLLKNGVLEPMSREQRMFYLAQTHQTSPYFYSVEDGTQYVEFDINVRLLWPQNKYAMNIADILNNFHYYCKDKLQIKTLQPVYFFIATCLHHYKDMNSPYLLHRKKRISFRRYCDIYYFIKNNMDQCSPETLALVGRELFVLPYLFYCIFQCNMIFEDNRLLPYIEALDSKKGRALVDVFGLSDLEFQKWRINLSDRIFTDSLQPYLETVLPKHIIESIQLNYKYL